MPEPTWRTVELDLEIYSFDIDFVGHVSNISYIKWLEIGRLRLLEEVGLPAHSLAEGGIVPIVIRTEIDYRRALRMGEPVHMSLHLSELRSVWAMLEFEITTGETVAASARQRGLFVNLATGKPRRVSPEFKACFQPYVRPAPVESG